MYEDRAKISGYTEVKKPSGETRLEHGLKYEDIPCRISRRGLATNGQTETKNNIMYEITLFIAPEIKIKQGDVIDVTGRGITRTYTAGEPFVYSSHQEVSLQRKEGA